MYLGLVVLLGVLLAGEILVARRGRRLVRLRTGAWLLAAVGAVGVLLAASADAGVSPTDLPGTSLGTDALLRLAPILLAGPLLLLAGRAPRASRPAALAAAGLIALALLADAAASHAAALEMPAVNVVLQWVHALAISVWLGALAGVLVELGDPDAADRAALMRRFSTWATAGILLVAVTGVARAAFELHNPGELLSTDYGRLILAKSALFAVLVVLGANNHFRHVPAGERRVGAMRRIGSLELRSGRRSWCSRRRWSRPRRPPTRSSRAASPRPGRRSRAATTRRPSASD